MRSVWLSVHLHNLLSIMASWMSLKFLRCPPRNVFLGGQKKARSHTSRVRVYSIKLEKGDKQCCVKLR
jgi:hypothetical protein